MSVLFEVYMFTPEYSAQIKKRETKAKSSMERDFVPEQGSVICLNVHREMAMPFFNVPELLDLFDTAWKLANEQDHLQPLRELGPREVPSNLATRAILEFTGDFKGTIRWDGNGAEEKFANREQLKNELEAKTMIEPTFLGGEDSPR